MTDRPLRCLVTGATGFLGRNILASLQSCPHVEIVAACRTRKICRVPLQAKSEQASSRCEFSSPFLTRSIVYLAEDWLCSTSYATRKLGYVPRKDWRIAIRESLLELRVHGHAWLPLAQAT